MISAGFQSGITPSRVLSPQAGLGRQAFAQEALDVLELARHPPFGDRVPGVAQGDTPYLQHIHLLVVVDGELDVQRHVATERFQLPAGVDHCLQAWGAQLGTLGVAVDQHGFLDALAAGDGIGQAALVVVVHHVIRGAMLQVVGHHHAAHLD
ncbi:hypothetical protein V8U11_31895 [Pseudomonas chlororaphis]|uniref:hypothetical protein n=1 Tax=Pseudomonas chlororaphis TaxID=587753 RepID=UPI0030D171BA